jgi:hypothetical protein
MPGNLTTKDAAYAALSHGLSAAILDTMAANKMSF